MRKVLTTTGAIFVAITLALGATPANAVTADVPTTAVQIKEKSKAKQSPPVLRSLSPSEVNAEKAKTVTIKGKRFKNVKSVTVGGEPVSFSVKSTKRITIKVPVWYTDEKVPVKVKTKGGSASLKIRFFKPLDNVDRSYYVRSLKDSQKSYGSATGKAKPYYSKAFKYIQSNSAKSREAGLYFEIGIEAIDYSYYLKESKKNDAQLTKLKYWLSIAVKYGDTLRAQELRSEISELESEKRDDLDTSNTAFKEIERLTTEIAKL